MEGEIGRIESFCAKIVICQCQNLDDAMPQGNSEWKGD